MTDAPSTEVDAQRAKQMIDDGAVVVDVRRQEEWDEGRLADSVRIEMTELSERAGEVPTDKPVIFICAVGNRSALATEAFRATGYDVYNLAGGIEAWAAQGLPVER